MYACLSCFSLFKPEIIHVLAEKSIASSVDNVEFDSFVPCPIADCGGQVINIDELILPSMLVLNYKGYATQDCCSGHVHNRIAETYITFAPALELPDMPAGFVQDELPEGDGHLTIRKLHDSIDRISSILLTNKKLYDWARGLPNLNEGEMEQWAEIAQRQNELLVMRMLAMGFSPYKQSISPLIKKKVKHSPA